MFPQLPFGFISNTRLYRATSALKVGEISLSTYIGEVKNALSNLGVQNINSYTDLQLLRYADSTLDLSDINIATKLDLVSISSSIINIQPLETLGGLNLVSSTLWTPLDTTTSLWFDANDASTITLNSGTVSQWNDKSGNSRHATQTVAASRPTVATAALNGLNGLSFDGTDDFLETVGYIAINTASASATLLIVSESSGTGRRGIMGTRPAANPEGWFTGYFNDRNRLIMFGTPATAASDSLGTNRNPDINGFIKTATTIKLISFLNGASTTGTVTLTPVSTADTTKIGREQTGSSGESLLGKIYEIIEMPTTDTTIRQKAEGYLAHKWGLTTNLPSNHPYKTNPPTV